MPTPGRVLRPARVVATCGAAGTMTRHCPTCGCSTVALIERRFRDDLAAFEHAGSWGLRIGDRVQMTPAGEAALLPRSMLAATRGTVYAALTWRTETGIARRAIAVLRDDYASPFWSPIPYWRRLRRRRTATPALERALQEAAAAR